MKKAYSTEELISGCINKDPKCLTLFFNRYRSKMFRKLHKYHYDINIIEDVISDGFMLAFENLHTLDNLDKIEHWLARIMKHRMIDEIRKEKNRRLSSDNFKPTTIYDVIYNTYDMEVLYEYLLLLPPVQSRTMLLLIEGYTPVEIAKETGVSISSVKTNTFKARKNFSNFILRTEGKIIDINEFKSFINPTEKNKNRSQEFKNLKYTKDRVQLEKEKVTC